MTPTPLRALGPLHHACHGCGGSCETVRPRALPDESAALEARAAELGVERPIVDGHLRQEGGRCVFLDGASRCRLHSTYGAEAKPRICRQYPVVVVDAGRERRIGLDPGCYTAIATWRTAPEPTDAWVVARGEIPEAAEREEAAVIGLLGRSEATLASTLDALVPDGSAAFGARLAERLASANLPALLARDDVGPQLRSALSWASGTPAPREARLDAECEAFAHDAVRRLVWLRLMPGFPAAPVALLGLAGALAASWVADETPTATRSAAFGAAVAGWTRAIRAPMFRKALLPDAAALQWLATGR